MFRSWIFIARLELCSFFSTAMDEAVIRAMFYQNLSSVKTFVQMM